MNLKTFLPSLGVLGMAMLAAAQEPAPRPERPERSDRTPPPGRSAEPGPLLKALDHDGDGTLSSDEIDMAVASLRSLDKNRDGSVTPDEIAPRRERGSRGGQQGATGGRKKSAQGLFVRDTNGDGKVTAADLPVDVRARFAEHDTDGDGELSKSERDAGIRALRERIDQLRGRMDGQRKKREGKDNAPVKPRRPGSKRAQQREI